VPGRPRLWRKQRGARPAPSPSEEHQQAEPRPAQGHLHLCAFHQTPAPRHHPPRVLLLAAGAACFLALARDQAIYIRLVYDEIWGLSLVVTRPASLHAPLAGWLSTSSDAAAAAAAAACGQVVARSCRARCACRSGARVPPWCEGSHGAVGGGGRSPRHPRSAAQRGPGPAARAPIFANEPSSLSGAE
jgi:hypothetical protein